MVEYKLQFSEILNNKLLHLAKTENIDVSELVAKAIKLYERSVNAIDDGAHVGIFNNNYKILAEFLIKDMDATRI